VPIGYYSIMKKYMLTEWTTRTDEQYRPRVTVIVPTYNEERYIQAKLSDLLGQTYPKNLFGTVVVDDGSEDGTVDQVSQWTKEHPGIDVKFFRRPAHQGKLFAFNFALRQLDESSELVVVTDADAIWDREALSNAVSYFADPVVGCVTCSISYTEKKPAFAEQNYRTYYNVLRIAESKKYSTPILNGPFLALRTKILSEKGFPKFPGSDDSIFGSFVAFIGYRSIQADNVRVEEPVRGNQFRTKVRRGNRLLLNFLNTKGYAKKLGVYTKSPFDQIWRIEWWLHVVNPWLLVTSILLLVYALLSTSILAAVFLASGGVLLFLRPYRTWILQQGYLVVASLRNLWTEDVQWSR